MEAELNLPSHYKIGDHVAVNLGYSGKFGGAKVTGVHFTASKVRYDLEIIVVRREPEEANHVTRIYNVDSALVISREDWLGYNQSLQAESMVFDTAYNSMQLPPRDENEEDLSDYVLIDTDGKRENFFVGYYDFSIKHWDIRGRDSEEIDLEHMRWTFLNLAKYEKNPPSKSRA